MGDLGATQVLGKIRQARTERELRELMQRGDANLAVVIPPDIERRIADGSRAAFQIIVDGSQPALENVASGLAAMPLLRRAGRPRPRGRSRSRSPTTRRSAPRCRSCLRSAA